MNQKDDCVCVRSKSQELNSSLQFQKYLLIQNGIKVEHIQIEIGSAANEIKN